MVRRFLLNEDDFQLEINSKYLFNDKELRLREMNKRHKIEYSSGKLEMWKMEFSQLAVPPGGLPRSHCFNN